MSHKKEFLIWHESERKRIWNCPVFTVDQSRRTSSDGITGDFILVNCPDWVTVIPVLKRAGKKDHFLIVNQYRHGIGEVTKEFPAGVIDSGETVLDAAARELREETGYKAGKLTLIGESNPNSAFMTNRTYTVLAEDLFLDGDLQLDETEQLYPEEIECEIVHKAMGEHPYDTAIIIQAYYWFLKHIKRI